MILSLSLCCWRQSEGSVGVFGYFREAAPEFVGAPNRYATKQT